jgi:uncharacterized membrane protein (DUF485 family)
MNNPAERVPEKEPQPDWRAIARSQDFTDLIALKRAFIVPVFVVFLLYYIGLAVLVGYAPRLAALRIIGTVNVAYLFALSQFVVGWIVAALYLFAASKFDALAADILRESRERQGGK